MFPLWAVFCITGVAKCFLYFDELVTVIPSILLVGCDFFFHRILHAIGTILKPNHPQRRFGLEVIVMCSVVLLLRLVWSLVPTGIVDWNSIMEEDEDLAALGKPLPQVTPRELVSAIHAWWFQKPDVMGDEENPLLEVAPKELLVQAMGEEL